MFLEDHSRDSISVQRFLESARRLQVPTTKSREATGTLASSVNLLLPDALGTGKLQIVPNAIAREITLDSKTGLVAGVHFVDRQSKRDYFAPARAVIVGASCLESTRLLLNSKSTRYPDGLANSSGVLGHYLFDQFYVKNVITAIVPDARGGKGPRHLMGGGGYIPRFRNLATREKSFLRGYSYDFGSGGTPPAHCIPKYGEALLQELNELSNAAFSMTTMGSVLPRFEHHASIDPEVKDAWGIPALHITQRYTDNEYEMAKDSRHMAEELCKGAGFEVLSSHFEMVPPGESIHELGTCRMGADPKTSVLNGFNQAHDVKNLFVMDGSSFVTGGSQNPTLTILALAMRSSEYLAEQLRKQNL